MANFVIKLIFWLHLKKKKMIINPIKKKKNDYKFIWGILEINSNYFILFFEKKLYSKFRGVYVKVNISLIFLF